MNSSILKEDIINSRQKPYMLSTPLSELFDGETQVSYYELWSCHVSDKKP